MAILTIAFYAGPPKLKDWQHVASHYGIRLWTWSLWSHAEWVDGMVCWSSSARDGGVRKKAIDLTSGRWDLKSKKVPDEVVEKARKYFEANKGNKYDWAGILRFVFPFLPHSKSRKFCFEALAEALNFPAAHKFTANDLAAWMDS